MIISGDDMRKAEKITKGIIYSLVAVLLLGGLSFAGSYVGYRVIHGPDYIETIDDEQFEEKDYFNEGRLEGYIGKEFAYVTRINPGRPLSEFNTVSTDIIEIPNEVQGKPVRFTTNTFGSLSSNRNAFSALELQPGNQYYVIENDTLFNADKTKVLFYFGSDLDIDIPQGVLEVCPFAYCRNIIGNVNLPDTLEAIGYSAFNSCGLLKLDMPDSVISVGDFAFSSNYITSLHLSSSLREIGSEAFAGLKVDELILPDGITTIGSSAFESSEIKKATLPKSLVSVGSKIFYRCPELEELNIECSLSVFDDGPEGGFAHYYYDDEKEGMVGKQLVINTAEPFYPCEFMSSVFAYYKVIINEPCSASDFDYRRGYTQALEHGYTDVTINENSAAAPPALELKRVINNYGYGSAPEEYHTTIVEFNFSE